MRRTISVMLGKGSVSHNSHEFMASNIDSERSSLNISYCNTPIKQIYSELFDDAVQRYNAKQTRADRCIDNYYDKIRTGKQEKLFHEVIIQIGNKDNMPAVSQDGQLAARVLGEYMGHFQERNPNLKVFSAHLHMDEATPHLHVDFVPFTTGSKRGLDTRVSLKQALAAQGFAGGTRGDTEWNQWVKSEKEHLSKVMERHGIEWEQLGTHNEHLSVMDYKKGQRTKEVAALDGQIFERQIEASALADKKAEIKVEINDSIAEKDKTKGELEAVRDKVRFVANNARHYDDDPEYELPDPKSLMSAKTYHERFAVPLVRELKDVIRSILLQYFEKTQALGARIARANDQIRDLCSKVEKLEPENEQLRSDKQDYERLRRCLGGERADKMIAEVKTQEIAERQAQQHHYQPKQRIKRERNHYAR